MSDFWIELTLVLLVAVGGTGLLLRSRALERRIFSIESSLGGFAGLGGTGGGGDPLGDDEVLRHLEAITESMKAETKTTDEKAPKSAKEP